MSPTTMWWMARGASTPFFNSLRRMPTRQALGQCSLNAGTTVVHMDNRQHIGTTYVTGVAHAAPQVLTDMASSSIKGWPGSGAIPGGDRLCLSYVVNATSSGPDSVPAGADGEQSTLGRRHRCQHNVITAVVEPTSPIYKPSHAFDRLYVQAPPHPRRGMPGPYPFEPRSLSIHCCLHLPDREVSPQSIFLARL